MVMHSKHLLNYYSVNEKLLSNAIASYSSSLNSLYLWPLLLVHGCTQCKKITEINIY